MANPQLENGHTRIANEILEKVIASGLNGTEITTLLLIWRKTYGYQKKEDEISLSQFCEAIPVSKETICNALSNLQLVKIIRLVKKGNSKKCSNLWAFNKDFDTWQLVKKTKLVRFCRPTSQDSTPPTSQENLTYKRNIQKKIQKKGNFVPPSLKELDDYINQQKYKGFTSQQWLNFYESKDWMIGKNKLRNWKAAVRTWGNKYEQKAETFEQEMERLRKEKGDNTAFFELKHKYGEEKMLPYFTKFDL